MLVHHEVIGYLPQELSVSPTLTVAEFFHRDQPLGQHPYNIAKILARVNLEQLSPEALVTQLSGGEKMRLGLAQLLLIRPSVLLLDEPTNNLDLASLAWLEKFVRSFSGKVLVISHDRYFGSLHQLARD